MQVQAISNNNYRNSSFKAKASYKAPKILGPYNKEAWMELAKLRKQLFDRIHSGDIDNAMLILQQMKLKTLDFPDETNSIINKFDYYIMQEFRKLGIMSVLKAVKNFYRLHLRIKKNRKDPVQQANDALSIVSKWANANKTNL